MVPSTHKPLIDQSISLFKKDDRVLALLGAGSMINNNMDQIFRYRFCDRCPR